MDGVVLLADPDSKAWDFVLKIKNYIKNEKREEVSLKELSLKHFRNKEEDIYIPDNIRRKEVFFPVQLTFTIPKLLGSFLPCLPTLTLRSQRAVLRPAPSVQYPRLEVLTGAGGFDQC